MKTAHVPNLTSEAMARLQVHQQGPREEHHRSSGELCWQGGYTITTLSIVDWMHVDNTSSFVALISLIGNFTLLGVTVWYAWQTQQMVREMREGRIASVRPILRLDIHLIGANVLLKIENVGPGPALDVHTSMRASDSSNDDEQTTKWNAPILRAGEHHLFHFPMTSAGDIPTFAVLQESECVVALSGTCQNAHGLEYTIKDCLRFGKTMD